MKLNEVRNLKQISEEYDIKVETLKKRIKLKSFDMIEGEDYILQGERQPTLLSPEGIEKITRK